MKFGVAASLLSVSPKSLKVKDVINSVSLLRFDLFVLWSDVLRIVFVLKLCSNYFWGSFFRSNWSVFNRIRLLDRVGFHLVFKIDLLDFKGLSCKWT